MNGAAPLPRYVWKSAEFPLCELSISALELATLLGISLETWDEDGLGPALGFTCKLQSGLAILAQELEYVSEKAGAPRTTVLIESCELVELGVERALLDILSAFELSKERVTWFQSEAGLRSAIQLGEAQVKKRGSE